MTTNNAVNTSLAGQTGTGTFVGSTSPTIATPIITGFTPTRQILTTGSSSTYTTPTNCRWIHIRMVGAGGGGSGSTTAGGQGTEGGAGADTVFNSITASGGSGGRKNDISPAGGAGGAASGGNILNIPGQAGFGVYTGGAAAVVQSGTAGGSNPLGFGGCQSGTTNAGQAGQGYGSGGQGGGNAAASTGGTGGGAGGYIEHVIVSPSATYTYTVSNTGGTAGTAGTGGQNGAAGAPGLIIVEEFYI